MINNKVRGRVFWKAHFLCIKVWIFFKQKVQRKNLVSVSNEVWSATLRSIRSIQYVGSRGLLSRSRIGFFLDPTTRRQRERQKTIGLGGKTTASHVHHAFLYISLPFLDDYDVNIPNFAFYGERKQATTNLYFSDWIWIWFLGIELQNCSLTFDKESG